MTSNIKTKTKIYIRVVGLSELRDTNKYLEEDKKFTRKLNRGPLKQNFCYSKCFTFGLQFKMCGQPATNTLHSEI